jgi:hypothetical protein
MSPGAIDHRIKELSQLWKLAMSLQTARRLGPVAEPSRKTPSSDPAGPRRWR